MYDIMIYLQAIWSLFWKYSLRNSWSGENWRNGEENTTDMHLVWQGNDSERRF